MEKQIGRYLQNYLLYALPFVLICMGWSTFRSEIGTQVPESFLAKAAWEFLSWNLMLWFALLIVFLFTLVSSPSLREKTLKRLANLKERDEREQYITGKAARAAYVSTLSLLILLLFFSVFSINIHRVPPAEAVEGKRGTVSLGMGFSLLDKKTTTIKNKDNEVLFESQDIPLSKSAILLLIIIWQLGVFNYSARKENLGVSS